MKKFTRFFLGTLLMLVFIQSIRAQCTLGDAYGSGTAASTCNTVTASPTCHYIDEYAQFTGLTIGNTYEIGSNVPGTSSATTVTAGAHELTLFDGTGAVLTSQTNATNNLINITFTATTTTVRVQMNTSGCGITGSYCHYYGLRCTSCAGPGAPTCPTLTAPTNNATGISTLPTLTWSAATNATTYDVYIDADATCSITPTTLVATVSTTSYTLTSSLSPSTNYRWMIVPKDCSGAAPASCTPFCFTTTVAPPANDNCTGTNGTPVALTPQPNASACSSPVAATTVGATQSNTNCSSTATNDDVWFSFTANATTQTVRFEGVTAVTGTVTSMGMDTYTTCGGTNSNCNTGVTLTSGAGQANLTGLTIGTTYFLRVWTAGTSNSATFNICIINPPTPPANDQCSGAITLTPATTCTPITGTTEGATDNNETGDCTAGTENAVWFKFVATAVTHTVIVDGDAGFDAVIGAVISCGSTSRPTGGSCTDATFDGEIETLNLSGLTIGNTYLIQVHDYQGDVSATSTFSICVTQPAPPPSNDLCSGAITISNGSSISVNNAAATDETTAQAPTCSSISTNTNGLWYKIQSTPNTAETVTLDGCNSGFDMRVKVYTGTCASPTCLLGDDSDDCSGPGNGNAETTTFNIPSTPTATDYFVFISGPDGLLEFFVSVALPLELTKFEGKLMSKSNLLSWETAIEKDVQWHIVERAADGVNFTEIGRTAGQLSSVAPKQYTLEDLRPIGKAYYRLRSVDLDGKETLSSVIVLERKGARFQIDNVFPSPTQGDLTVQFNAMEESSVNVMVHDFSGRLVLQQQLDAAKGFNQTTLQLGSLPAGMYNVTIFGTQSATEPVRIVKE